LMEPDFVLEEREARQRVPDLIEPWPQEMALVGRYLVNGNRFAVAVAPPDLDLGFRPSGRDGHPCARVTDILRATPTRSLHDSLCCR
jgi:hypothetical protein